MGADAVVGVQVAAGEVAAVVVAGDRRAGEPISCRTIVC